ncbi:MAG: CHAP domain-containing protein [Eubacterium sp.]
MKKAVLKISFLFLALIMLSNCLTPICAFSATQEEIRNKVVSTASGEVGYTGTSTYSKYGEWYGYQGGWCTIFVLWCFNEAGEDLGVSLYGKIVPSGGNCNSMISWFSEKGRYYSSDSNYTPKSGDLVFFDWSGNGSSQHVGIVDYTSGNTVYTIEGNCSGQVKAREYTKTGSKPYNNISAIMGYASPDFSSAASGKSEKTEAQKPKTTKSTTKKPSTTVQTTSQATSTTQATTSTTSSTTTTKAAESTTEFTTEKETTTESIPLTKLNIHAATYELQIGDSVTLEYSVEPKGAPAVVGYFCDEEGIIEIGHNGNIKAIGIGTATVVVCANNELYSQCDFTVSQTQAQVTTQSQNTTRKIVGTTEKEIVTTKRNVQSVLTRMGVNVTALSKNKELYIIPASIAGATLVISLFVFTVKKLKK